MESNRKELLYELMRTPAPAGEERPRHDVWRAAIGDLDGEVRTDAYGNVVKTLGRRAGGPTIGCVAHGDEIGYVVTRIDRRGYLHVRELGRPVGETAVGQRVVVHGRDGRVPGVVGPPRGESTDASALHVDIGASDRERAESLVEVGSPVTFSSRVQSLDGNRIAGRLDNAAGMWVVADVLQRLAGTDRIEEGTVHGISTVQEELGNRGAQMLGSELDLDAAVAVDVTFASDHPSGDPNRNGDVSVGGGPVVGVGMANHPELVDRLRDVAERADVPIQLQAAGNRTGSDADAFYTADGGVPSVKVGVPVRYNHSPDEIGDLDDVRMAADLLVELVRNFVSQPPSLDS